MALYHPHSSHTYTVPGHGAQKPKLYDHNPTREIHPNRDARGRVRGLHMDTRAKNRLTLLQRQKVSLAPTPTHTVRRPYDPHNQHLADPVLLRSNEHFCQIRPVLELSLTQPPVPSSRPRNPPTVLSQDVSIDTDSQLTPEERAKFCQLHSKYVNVFNPCSRTMASLAKWRL